MGHNHNHKKKPKCPNCGLEFDFNFEETKKRSIAKSISFRLVEIGVAATVMFLIIGNLELAVGLVLIEEGTCFLLGYIWERIWNRIPWGKIVVSTNWKNR